MVGQRFAFGRCAETKNVALKPSNGSAILDHCVLAKSKEGEEHIGSDRSCPPEEVRPAQRVNGDQDDGETVDVLPVRVDVSPARPRAKAVSIIEKECEREDEEVPDHQSERHRHETEVTRGSETRIGSREMARKRRATLEEVEERKTCSWSRSTVIRVENNVVNSPPRTKVLRHRRMGMNQTKKNSGREM